MKTFRVEIVRYMDAVTLTDALAQAGATNPDASSIVATEVVGKVLTDDAREKNCLGCQAWDAGMCEVHFEQGCAGCAARMRVANGISSPVPESQELIGETETMIRELNQNNTKARHKALGLRVYGKDEKK